MGTPKSKIIFVLIIIIFKKYSKPFSAYIFAQNENSSPFSTVNVIAVGVRGIFVPLIGAYLLAQFGALTVIIVSGMLCLLASVRMAIYSHNLSTFSEEFSTNVNK